MIEDLTLGRIKAGRQQPTRKGCRRETRKTLSVGQGSNAKDFSTGILGWGNKIFGEKSKPQAAPCFTAMSKFTPHLYYRNGQPKKLAEGGIISSI